jgi:hypothetical protein
VNGSSSGALTTADADATVNGVSCGSYCYEYMGGRIATGDVDGDGFDDLLAGAAWGMYGKGYVFMGPVSSTTAASADASFTATATYSSYGQSLAIANLDGDEYGDTAIGEPYDWATSAYGAVFIYMGPASGAGTADLVVTGTTMYGYSGYGLANVGDTDADGLDELAQGGPYAGSSYLGEVHVYNPGSTTGTVSASTIAMATLSGEASYDNFGQKLAGGDYNDDGYSDVFVPSMYADDGVTYSTGRVYGFFGPLSGALSASSADVTVASTVEYTYIGTDIAMGDVSGDGTADVVIGAAYSDDYIGNAYILSGPTTGYMDLDSTASVGKPDGATMYNGYVGYAVGTMGDWTGDGAGEVIVAGYGMPYDAKTYYAGKAWVVGDAL